MPAETPRIAALRQEIQQHRDAITRLEAELQRLTSNDPTELARSIRPGFF